ncbi:hypothetical protein DXG03_008264 [Asterophora parasitica]|uniref:2,4-dienoyl-CoA reductase [(3E)-enoyl-CoA-producing] n=1 Tax=Asterophora parasitica TaxID=117018 RepID=A0A9P7G5N5_9AGAR|nr:hypothetical protein DXG03_008264 [Asterophora parasitica]
MGRFADNRLDRLTQAAKELSETTGQTCIPVQADVRDPKSIQEAVRKTIEKFGRIDFVVNGALRTFYKMIHFGLIFVPAASGAAGNFLAPISGLSENAFRTVMEIDTIGTYNTIKATIAHVRASKGSYIQVSATLHYQGTPYQAHVSAAKAGVDALSAVLAVEEGPHGVRSNVIAPGPIGNTEGMDRLSLKGDDPDSHPFPVGRMGHVQDVANATVFLFSDAAAYITGQVLPVDGGFEHLRGSSIPYPKGVLDPASISNLVKGKL